MRKFIGLLLISITIYSNASAQAIAEPSSKQAKATEEIRAVLASKLTLPDDVVEKIVPVENEFSTSLASTQAMTNLSLKDREKRLNAAHVTAALNWWQFLLPGGRWRCD